MESLVEYNNIAITAIAATARIIHIQVVEFIPKKVPSSVTEVLVAS